MNNKGFTLLEILVVLVIMGIIGAIVVPNIGKRQPRYEREQFIARLSALVQLGWQQAIIQNKVTKILFDVGTQKVSLQIATEQYERSGEQKFIPLTGQYLATTIEIPEQIKIKNIYIEGFDEMSRFVGRKTAEIWFFMVPEGLVQDVILNFYDMKDKKNAKPRPIGLVLNPFNAQFKVYDEFQKP